MKGYCTVKEWLIFRHRAYERRARPGQVGRIGFCPVLYSAVTLIYNYYFDFEKEKDMIRYEFYDDINSHK